MTREEVTAHVEKTYSGKLTALETSKDAPLYEIKPAELVEICRSLKEDDQLKLDYLCCLSTVDTGEHFEILYHLTSIATHARLDLKLTLSYDQDKTGVDSVREIWPGADWFEREIWELYGITVNNHPNIGNFLLPENWDQGFPMRKDWDAPDFIRMPEK